MWSNCLVWAIQQWKRHGGYILMRRSHWGKFPHFLWMSKDRKQLASFVPDNPKRKKFPPPIFKGHVRTDD
jgi:hypothetical protein